MSFKVKLSWDGRSLHVPGKQNTFLKRRMSLVWWLSQLAYIPKSSYQPLMKASRAGGRAMVTRNRTQRLSGTLATSSITSVTISCTPASALTNKQKVLVVGNSASGRDISKQLVGVADCVTVSTQRPNQRLSDDSHIKKGPIRRFLSRSGEVEFEDGTVSRFDNIIWCTGYKYDFAFIKNGGGGELFQEDFRVPGTYRHIFYIPKYGRNPSLAFVGLLKMVPWTVLELQGSLIASVFAGRANTPSRRDMEKWEQKTINA